MKKKQVTCKCPAYPFPHRQGGGDCRLPVYCDCFPIGCFDCCYQIDGCAYEDQVNTEIDLIENPYDPREEALTIQERNPDFRSW